MLKTRFAQLSMLLALAAVIVGGSVLFGQDAGNLPAPTIDEPTKTTQTPTREPVRELYECEEGCAEVEVSFGKPYMDNLVVPEKMTMVNQETGQVFEATGPFLSGSSSFFLLPEGLYTFSFEKEGHLVRSQGMERNIIAGQDNYLRYQLTPLQYNPVYVDQLQEFNRGPGYHPEMGDYVSFRGMVTDKYGNRLPGVRVSLKEYPQLTTTTRQDGLYEIRLITTEEVVAGPIPHVTFEHPDYVSQERRAQNLWVREGVETSIRLHPKNPDKSSWVELHQTKQSPKAAPTSGFSRRRGSCGLPTRIQVSNDDNHWYPMEDYVKKVLFHEWVPDWGQGGANSPDFEGSSETFKAAAIAIRSYAMRFASQGSRICPTTSCQRFDFEEDEVQLAAWVTNTLIPNYPIINQAVEDTRGWVVKHNGSFVKSEYAAETNDGCPPQSCNCILAGQPGNTSGYCKHWSECGDGKFQMSHLGPPCIGGGCYPNNGTIDFVSLGRCDPASHPRAMSQRGSFRWATGLDVGSNNVVSSSSVLPGAYNGVDYCTKDWQQILLHYYPYYTLHNCNTGDVYAYDDIHPTGRHECMPLCTDDPFEPNNTPPYETHAVWPTGASAYDEGDYNEQLLAVSCPGDEDWYMLPVIASGDFSISVSPFSANVDVYVHDQLSGAIVAQSEQSGTRTESTSVSVDMSGFTMCPAYYVQVVNRDQHSTSYLLNVNWQGTTDIFRSGGLSVTASTTRPCAGHDVVLTASGGSGNYEWQIDDGSSTVICSGCPVVTVSPQVPTTYGVRDMDGAGCITGQIHIDISSQPLNVVVTPTSPIIAHGTSVRLYASGGTSYSWSPAVGLSDPHVWNPVAAPTATTTYTVVAEGGHGCQGTGQVTVTVQGSGSGPSPPANDEPCDAMLLSVAEEACSRTVATNQHATASTVPIPGICSNTSTSGSPSAGYQGGDVWFRCTAPPSGIIVVATYQASQVSDVALAAYRGSCSNLQLFMCMDDVSPSHTMPVMALTNLVPGETIWIRAWEFGNDVSGSFEICATTTASSGGGGGGNTAPGPNLVARILSPVSGTSYAQGATFSASVRIENIGNQSAGSNYCSVGISNSADFPLVTGGLLAFETVPALGPGDVHSFTFTETLPSLDDGQYYLIAAADGPLDHVSEPDESDNVAGVLVSVGNSVVHGPDLWFEHYDVSPRSGIQPGITVELSHEIANDGDRDASRSTSRVFLSEDDEYDPGLDQLVWSASTSDLEEGTSDYDDDNIVFPFVSRTGTWYFVYVADVHNDVDETDETNNIRSRSITISTTSPATADYVTTITGLRDKTTGQAIVDEIPMGHELEVDIRTVNQGLVRPDVRAKTRVIVSPLPMVYPIHAYIGQDNHSSSGIRVGRDETYGADNEIYGGQVGLNYIVVQTDFEDAIFEGASGEANNTVIRPITLTVSGRVADLEPRILSVEPFSMRLGDEVTVTTRVYNHGDTVARRILMRHWVSPDNQFDGEEVDGRLEHQYQYIDSVPAGDSVDVVRQMVVDNDWGHPLVVDAAGPYFVLATVNPSAENPPEQSLLNNSAAAPMFVHDASCFVNVGWDREHIDTMPWTGHTFQNIEVTAPDNCPYIITASDPSWIGHPHNVLGSGSDMFPVFIEANRSGYPRWGCYYFGQEDSLCFVQMPDTLRDTSYVVWDTVYVFDHQGASRLVWSMHAEQGVRSYQAQRADTAGVFTTFATRFALGRDSVVYGLDDSARPGTTHYRVIATSIAPRDTSEVATITRQIPGGGSPGIVRQQRENSMVFSEPVDYSIFDVTGQRRAAGSCSAGQECFVRWLPSGLYLLVAEASSGTIVQRVIF